MTIHFWQQQSALSRVSSVIPSILGLGVMIDYANQIGIDPIYQRVQQLTKYLIKLTYSHSRTGLIWTTKY